MAGMGPCMGKKREKRERKRRKGRERMPAF